ncbi:fimbrial protein [Pantoea sp.]|uniref:fimbrial protein n=1 Tax=Pantoea sp. TaxID=69393 RepID=UPI0031D10270
MKFKKSVLGAILVMGMTSASAFAANNGTITFSGAITDGSCQIPVSQMTRTINLDNVGASDLNTASIGTSVQEEALQFDAAYCPNTVTDVAVQFDFTPDATNSQYIANTGDAQGVLFGITDANDTLVANGGSVAADAVSGTGTATVNAKIRAYRVGSAAPVAGSIASTATVTLITQ